MKFISICVIIFSLGDIMNTQFEQTKIDSKNGLTQTEAERRIIEYGENKLKEKRNKSLFVRFLEQFKDVMIIILLVAALISFVVAIVERQPSEFIEPLLILLIVILNATIGVIQENKAEKALKALQNISAPHSKVIRDGQERIIDSSKVVPGDLIVLEAGDFVPADARLITSVNLKCEESALTGESVPVEKDANAIVKVDAPLSDRVNMVFSGCAITYGRATAIVTATGMNTEIGKIASLLNNEKETKTPLQKKLAKLGKYLGIIALLACVIIFIVGIVSDLKIIDVFMTSVSLAVSAIPEGLPAIVTIILSIGVQRMVKKNAIIRRLPAVETLGSASIICSDKTGTLTQNKMTLVKIYTDNGELLGFPNDVESTKQLIEYASLCSDANIVTINGEEVKIGDPTETAIVSALKDLGKNKDELNTLYPRLTEIPFDSNRKLMTTINRIDDKNVVIVKGAFDVLLKKCIKGDKEKAEKINEEMSKNALRVLAVAYKEVKKFSNNPTSEELESDLKFLGLIGMIDPPRPEAKVAVKECKNAGIKPIMITGDHIITATAIAKELGIYEDGDRAVLGSELDKMSDEEFFKNVKNISVYARVTPENKIRIVKAWQKLGKVVSMTGDGVNDAPALKAADIGCAMGITGTDVAKSAADMTLTDDNFATIVDAVKEGRGIYDNIKKVVGFLLGTNIGEIVVVFLMMVIWKISPFISIQLLWINLITDSLPAIALGMEPVEKDIMTKNPRPKDESLFANGYGVRIALQGLMFGLLTLAGFWIGKNLGGTIEAGRTTAFIVLACSQILHSYNARSDKSLFKIGIFSNKKLNYVNLISFATISFVVFTPVVVNAFGMCYLPYYCYLIAILLSFVPIIIIELSKAFGLIRHEENLKIKTKK